MASLPSGSRENLSARERRAVAVASAVRRNRRARVTVTGGVLVVAIGLVGWFLATRGPEGPRLPHASAAGLRTTPPPWPAQPAGLQERLGDLKFPPVGDESYHVHILLSVYRNGEKVTVPENIGFETTGAHSSLHTHTPDGVVHMEADDPYPYELGHFFTVWGVAFGADRLGGDVAGGDKKVHIYVNGKRARDERVVLADGDNVVVAYGEDGSFPTQPDAGALENA